MQPQYVKQRAHVDARRVARTLMRGTLKDLEFPGELAAHCGLQRGHRRRLVKTVNHQRATIRCLLSPPSWALSPRSREDRVEEAEYLKF